MSWIKDAVIAIISIFSFKKGSDKAARKAAREAQLEKLRQTDEAHRLLAERYRARMRRKELGDKD